jgi:hypothetical protein
LKRHHGGTDHTEDTQRLLHRLSAAAPSSRRTALCAARVPAAARGRHPWAGPSGLAADVVRADRMPVGPEVRVEHACELGNFSWL